MIISGIDLANEQKIELEQLCLKKKNLYGRAPSLHVILVGDNPASKVYVGRKTKKADSIGINTKVHEINAAFPQDIVIQLIHDLNNDPLVDAILVQLPLPPHYSKIEILNAINPIKDVDGLCSTNLGLLMHQNPQHIPCTPLACLQIIKSWKDDLTGLNAVIVGRSTLVGLPLSILLINENVTVTICHSKTRHLESITSQADILVVACGSPHLIKNKHVKKNACVIDVGISKQENGMILGDVDFENVYTKTAAITPVPGGVGPVTVSNVLKNTIKAMDYHLNCKR